MDLPIYIINLDKYNTKYKQSYSILKKQGFENINRISAIDGTTLSDPFQYITFHTQFLIDNPEYRCSHQQLNTLGGIGCYLSHVKCWKELLISDYPGVLIFEDDLQLIPNFKEEYLKMIENIPSDCDVLSFGYLKLFNKQKFKNPIELVRSEYYGNQAYYITRNGAKTLLTKAFPIEIQIDGYMSLMNYYSYINIYFTKQTLVTQHNPTGSSINYVTCYKCYLPNSNMSKEWIILILFLITLCFILLILKQIM